MTDHGAGAAAAPRVRTFLVDDHEVVRRGVRQMLEASQALTVVGEAASAKEAAALIPRAAPDVAILDVRLPDADGITLCRDLRSQVPELRCLMLTSFDDEAAQVGALMAGASGYVLKQVRGGDLIDAVLSVARGESLISRRRAEELLERRTGAAAGPLSALTPQERRILGLIAEGLTNKQIAIRMQLSDNTVKNYVSSLLTKLGLERRTQAAILATNLDRMP